MAAKKKAAEPAFTKEAILASKKYAPCIDAVNVCLKDGETYTEVEIEKRLKAFLEKEV